MHGGMKPGEFELFRFGPVLCSEESVDGGADIPLVGFGPEFGPSGLCGMFKFFAERGVLFVVVVLLEGGVVAEGL